LHFDPAKHSSHWIPVGKVVVVVTLDIVVVVVEIVVVVDVVVVIEVVVVAVGQLTESGADFS